MNKPDAQAAAFAASDSVNPDILAGATRAAIARGVPVAHILQYEYHVPRHRLIGALTEYYGCPVIEYDERMLIPPELLWDTPKSRLEAEGWFPVIKDEDGTVVVAAVDPSDPGLPAAVTEVMGSGQYEFRVTLPHDISSFIEDFLHAPPGKLIGTERTGLAFWRNTMAQWRTRMACYRTDMAKARTALAVIRAGLALITIAQALTRIGRFPFFSALPLGSIVLGILLIVYAAPIYLRVRRSRLNPHRNQALVSVTGATLKFMDSLCLPGSKWRDAGPEENGALPRTWESLPEYCTVLYPVPESRERTYLARERNILAAQRTIAGCYRTIYARARTGLAFIRTGFAFMSISIGLLTHFGLGLYAPFDLFIMVVGVMMIVDGFLWYLPVHREQGGLPYSRSEVMAG